MNVRVKKAESPETSGERKPHILVASKGFEAGDIIYTVRDSIEICLYETKVRCRKNLSSLLWMPMSKDVELTARTA